MVLGFLRRRKQDRIGQSTSRVSSGDLTGPITGPLGEFIDEGYVPDPRELAAAKPLPQVLFEPTMLDMISEEELEWVLKNKDTWRPRKIRGQRGAMLAESIRLPGYELPYDAMIWDGRGNVYLVDALTYALLYDSRGEQTAREIVENLLTQFIERLPEGDNMRVAFEKNPEEMTEDDEDIVYGSIGNMYAQLALLRRLGLLI